MLGTKSRLARRATSSSDKVKDDSRPNISDPNYEDKINKKLKRRGVGHLIHKLAKTKPAPTKDEADNTRPSKVSTQFLPNVVPDALCPREANGERCWSVIADADLMDRVKIQVDNLLYSQDHKLFQHDRLALSVYFELFFIGESLEKARMAVIISCTSERDRERVHKLIKKYPNVPEYSNIELLTVVGSLRSSVPLIKLASGNSVDAPSEGNEQVLVGSRVYGTIGESGALTIPAIIWLGNGSQRQHKATLGGLLSATDDGMKLGLTVAHLPSVGNPEGSPAVDGSSLTAIGTIIRISEDQDGRSFDWALVKFDIGIHPRTSIAPPISIGSTPYGATAIHVLTPRGSIRGTLSGSLTFINIDGTATSTKTRSIVVDQPIRSGDCGSWVVGPNQELYGSVVYGHDGENVAYIIPADDTFNQIEKSLKVKLSGISARAQQKLTDEQEQVPQAAVKDQTPFPDANARSNTARKRDPVLHKANLQLRKWQGSEQPKEMAQRNLAGIGICLYYLVFLGIISMTYFSVSAFAFASGSKVASQQRGKLAPLMQQIVDELRGWITKETTKFGPNSTQSHEKPRGRSKKILSAQPVSKEETKPPHLPPNSPPEAGSNTHTNGPSSNVYEKASEARPPRTGIGGLWKQIWKKSSEQPHQPPSVAVPEPNLPEHDANAVPTGRYGYSDDESSSVSSSSSQYPLQQLAQAIGTGLGRWRRRKEDRRSRVRSRALSRRRSISPRERERERSRDRSRYYDDDYVQVRHRSRSREGGRQRKGSGDSEGSYYYEKRTRSRSRGSEKERRRNSLIEYGADAVYDRDRYDRGYHPYNRRTANNDSSPPRAIPYNVYDSRGGLPHSNFPPPHASERDRQRSYSPRPRSNDKPAAAPNYGSYNNALISDQPYDSANPSDPPKHSGNRVGQSTGQMTNPQRDPETAAEASEPYSAPRQRGTMPSYYTSSNTFPPPPPHAVDNEGAADGAVHRPFTPSEPSRAWTISRSGSH